MSVTSFPFFFYSSCKPLLTNQGQSSWYSSVRNTLIRLTYPSACLFFLAVKVKLHTFPTNLTWCKHILNVYVLSGEQRCAGLCSCSHLKCCNYIGTFPERECIMEAHLLVHFIDADFGERWLTSMKHSYARMPAYVFGVVLVLLFSCGGGKHKSKTKPPNLSSIQSS